LFQQFVKTTIILQGIVVAVAAAAAAAFAVNDNKNKDKTHMFQYSRILSLVNKNWH